MTDAPASRVRPARRSPFDLSFHLDEAHVESIAAAEPDWLAADRRAAFAGFTALPIESNMLYTTYVDLRTAVLDEVRPYDRSTSDDLALNRATEPEAGTAGLAAYREERVDTMAVDGAARAAGVTLEPLGELVTREPDVAERLLTGTVSLAEDDRLAQLTRAGWTHGIVLRVPAGVRLTQPVVLRWAVGAPERALLTRTIVELGDGAEATILEELVPSGEGVEGRQSLFTGTMEVVLGRDAKLSVSSLQELPASTVAFQHRHAVVGEGATLHWAVAQLGSRLVRSRVDNVLEGDRSSVEQVEIVFGSEDQLFDLTSYTRHIGRDTTGNLLSKGALMDKAKSFMKGMIVIEKSAVGTDSFLGEFGMNLSKATRSVAIPSLEIDQPDCRRAAHASSVGPIDESQLFYLESRGIPPDEARKFIVLGFLEPVVARVPLVEAQDRLRELLDAKWDAGAGLGTGGVAAA
jgi:Fe-S cluster assembly scaffold protein SufB